MKRCNYCGKTKHDIVIASILDGNVCKDCVDKYFMWSEEGRYIPKNYDRELLIDTLFRIDAGLKMKMISQLKDIQTRYICRIKKFKQVNETIVIEIDSQFRKGKATIEIIGDTRTQKATCNMNITKREKEAVM